MPKNSAIEKLARARPPHWTWQAQDCLVALSWASHGHTLAAASLSGELAVLDARNGQPRWKKSAHALGVLWCAFHPEATILASGGQDGTAKIWDAHNGTLLHTLAHEKNAWVEHGGWAHDGMILATAAGKKISFWQPDGTLRQQTQNHPHTLLSLDWHPRRHRLLSSAMGGVQEWSPEQLEPVATTPWPGAALVVRWSTDGKFIAAGNQDASLHAWADGTTDNLRMAGYGTKIRELAWRCDGRQLSTGGGVNVVTWNFSGAGPSGTTPIEHRLHADFITALAAHPQRPELVASAGADQFIFVWHDKEEHPLWNRCAPLSVPQTLAWHPSGDGLVAGCRGGELHFWKVTLTK